MCIFVLLEILINFGSTGLYSKYILLLVLFILIQFTVHITSFPKYISEYLVKY
jgi:hypothetical protein